MSFHSSDIITLMFLQVNNTWCVLKNDVHDFFNHALHAFFLFQNISEAINVFQALPVIPFSSYSKYKSYRKSGTYELCLLELKLIKRLIFSFERAGFFVIQIAIISATNVMLIILMKLKQSTSLRFYKRII